VSEAFKLVISCVSGRDFSFCPRRSTCHLSRTLQDAQQVICKPTTCIMPHFTSNSGGHDCNIYYEVRGEVRSASLNFQPMLHSISRHALQYWKHCTQAADFTGTETALVQGLPSCMDERGGGGGGAKVGVLNAAPWRAPQRLPGLQLC